MRAGPSTGDGAREEVRDVVLEDRAGDVADPAATASGPPGEEGGVNDRDQALDRLHLQVLLRRAVLTAIEDGVELDDCLNALENEWEAVTAELMAAGSGKL